MIYIGSDHAGFELKEIIKHWLSDNGRAYSDVGTKSTDSCDYPDFALTVAKKVSASVGDLGILICGSGIGMAIAANKVKGVRAAQVFTDYMAQQAREHDDANVLVLASRVSDSADCVRFVELFLESQFDTTVERHVRRVQKITAFEETHLT
jgi:ribose 5-phosphate isomerase B